MDITKALARATFRELRERNPSSTRANNSFHTPVIWYLSTDLPRRIASHHGRFAILQGHVAPTEVTGVARRRKRWCAVNIGSWRSSILYICPTGTSKEKKEELDKKVKIPDIFYILELNKSLRNATKMENAQKWREWCMRNFGKLEINWKTELYIFAETRSYSGTSNCIKFFFLYEFSGKIEKINKDLLKFIIAINVSISIFFCDQCPLNKIMQINIIFLRETSIQYDHS